MKFLITVLLSTISFFTFSQKDSTTKFATKEYSINYPTNWKIDTSKIMGSSFFIFSPLENGDDKFSENVGLIIQDLGQEKVDLGMYEKITLDQIKKLVTEGEVFFSQIIKTDKTEFHKIIYAMTQGTLKLKTEQYCFISNQKLYILTLSCEAKNYESYQSIGEQILNSFTLKK